MDGRQRQSICSLGRRDAETKRSTVRAKGTPYASSCKDATTTCNSATASSKPPRAHFTAAFQHTPGIFTRPPQVIRRVKHPTNRFYWPRPQLMQQAKLPRGSERKEAISRAATMSSTTAPLVFPAGGGARPLQGQRDAAAAAAGGGGSYTPVFVVLGVIAALLVISCLVGQVCTKKHLRPRPRRDRVAFYDDDMEAGAHAGPPRHGVAKMEAPASGPAVETRAAAGDGTTAAIATHQVAGARD
ncbi:hypothetical protein BS78_09G240400 [Paspalum vaginatum]|nr:hypothetical protein BS78_09G240400 [Paspalum vaginatum]